MTIDELKNISQIDSDLENLSYENINDIKIVSPNSDFRGKTEPNFINNKLVSDILYDENVIKDLLSYDIDNKKEALSIILHELYHYKECIITANKMDYHKLIFDDNYSDTYTMAFSLGYKQWTEYYAYYNSSKYYQRNIYLDDFIRKSWASLYAMQSFLTENDTTKMPFSVYTDIKDFISYSIIFAAQYNSLLDSKYLESIMKFKRNKDYCEHYDYIIELIPYMNDLYSSYPSWVSEEKFIEIGKYLLNILHRFNITYSTNDLSDNFVFIPIK